MQCADRQFTGDVPVRYAGDHAPVMEVYDGAVVPDIPVLQEQVCEIRTPFLIWPVRMEVLPQSVSEYFMRIPGFCLRFLGADDGMQPQFRIHIFMDCCRTVAVSPAFQIGRHATIPVHPIVTMVDFADLPLDFRFFGIIIRLPVFPVVIVGIRADPQPPQQPADAEFFLMLIDEPVSL